MGRRKAIPVYKGPAGDCRRRGTPCHLQEQHKKRPLQRQPAERSDADLQVAKTLRCTHNKKSNWAKAENDLDHGSLSHPVARTVRTLCFDFSRGSCARGHKCFFSHAYDPAELLERKLCFRYQTGECNDRNCIYVHQLAKCLESQNLKQHSSRKIMPSTPSASQWTRIGNLDVKVDAVRIDSLLAARDSALTHNRRAAAQELGSLLSHMGVRIFDRFRTFAVDPVMAPGGELACECSTSDDGIVSVTNVLGKPVEVIELLDDDCGSSCRSDKENAYRVSGTGCVNDAIELFDTDDEDAPYDPASQITLPAATQGIAKATTTAQVKISLQAYQSDRIYYIGSVWATADKNIAGFDVADVPHKLTVNFAKNGVCPWFDELQNYPSVLLRPDFSDAKTREGSIQKLAQRRLHGRKIAILSVDFLERMHPSTMKSFGHLTGEIRCAQGREGGLIDIVLRRPLVPYDRL